MYTIATREFFGLFKSIKSLIIIAILFLASYFSAKYADILLVVGQLSEREAENIHSAGLLILLLLFGLLFIMGLSHDSLNREIHERTIRFLITRASRSSITVGKFLGIWFFWFVCITISFILISIYAHKIDLFIFSQIMSLLTYQIALTLLLSMLIPKPGITMFLGVILGLGFPIVGLWVSFTSNIWLSWTKFLVPYYYLNQDNYAFLIILLLAGILLLFTFLMLKRRDC
ncbi:hypothetical protein [Lederbergia galactosidilytica]|uniref:Membrane protein n=1 Tax=Lederbergia galactosidilytica TaxID=217031 RepID=A0A0Q9YAC9_9BACI|nr:hypothetical protein [Lederbergia galactosidilytica]KRG14062.1 membrane protein [Lederbergia galactosidilytica]KRG16478.1 membrane protein [Virgibacillus soli]OAK67353.1 membrane protein [Lederbergia galactosidilytica]